MSVENLTPARLHVFDLIQVGILVVGEGNILFANKAFAHRVGRPSESLAGQSLQQLGGEAWEYLSLGQDWADALPWPGPNDSTLWFEVEARDAQLSGSPVAVMTCIDVTARMRAEGSEASMLQMISEIIEGSPVGTFVLDENHCVSQWNRACEALTGIPASNIVGSDEAWRVFFDTPRPLLADLVMQGLDEAQTQALYAGRLWRSSAGEYTYVAELFFPRFGSGGRWLQAAATPLRNANGKIVGAIETLVDVTEQKEYQRQLELARASAEELVAARTQELQKAKHALEEDVARRQRAEEELLHHLTEVTKLNTQLHETQERLMQSQQQLVQSEKLASIGQLAAGVAHEINNPIGYVFSNFSSLQTYIADILRLLDAYIAAEDGVGDDERRRALQTLRAELDVDFVREDILALMHESREGIERVRKIVQDLKDFSHVDASPDWQWADLHRGLDSTLNIVHNEIKYSAEVQREFGELPQIQCLPSQLNQVFMNLLVNAAHAMKDTPRGTITVRTGHQGDEVWVEVQDTGCGMSEEIMSRIFDPFFTTKPVGKGTGLGLSLSYGIVQKHHGRMEVSSTPGAGSTFRIVLPIRQPDDIVKEAA